jgi:hypothetical protein
MDPIGIDKSSRVRLCPETLTPTDAKSVPLKYKSYETVPNLEHKLTDPAIRALVINVISAAADGASTDVNLKVVPDTAAVLEKTASVVVADTVAVVAPDGALSPSITIMLLAKLSAAD